MKHRRSARRFVQNKRTRTISVHSSPGTSPVRGDVNSAFNVDSMLAALIEVEPIISPAIAREHISPHLAVALLADGIYHRLTGEKEFNMPRVRAELCTFILTAWSRGHFTPSSAFPYSYDQVVKDFKPPPGG